MLPDEALRTPAEALQPSRSRLRSASRFAISVLVSGGLSWGLARVLRRPLDVHTDIVGYPIFANFNGFNYFTQYYITILCFPWLALLLYVALGRIWRGSDWPARTSRTDLELPRAARALVSVLPSLAVGAAIGTGWVLASASPTSWMGLVPFATALLYSVTVWLVGLPIARRSGREHGRLVSVINAVVAPFSLILLGIVSAETWVRVEDPPGIDRYLPFPPALILVLLGAALLWTGLRLRGGPRSPRLPGTESVLLMVVPVLLVVYTASIPPPFGKVDFFHFGELVGGAHLVSHGAFPWRDLFFIHGLMQDVLLPWLGFLTFGTTVWGAWAGFEFWGTLAWWLAYYALFLYLFRDRPLLLLVAVMIPFGGAYPYVHHRFALYPVLLLALAAVLRRPSWPRAIALAAALLVGNVLVPELAYVTIAAGAVLLCYEISRKERGNEIRTRLVGTRRFVLAGAVLAAGWCGFLHGHGALAAFVDYYRTFAPGHQLTGAIPIDHSFYRDPYFVGLMLLPPLTTVLMVWYLISRWRGRIPLRERDWVMLAATLATATYYSKFLSRADWHVAQAAAASLPLVFFLLDRGLDIGGALVPRRAAPWIPVVGALGVLVWALHASPPDQLRRIGQLGSRYHFTVAERPTVARFGWSGSSIASQMDEVRTLRAFLDRELDPGAPIFDFTNQPALYHFLLDVRPASRFFHVSMAIRSRSQRMLIEDLDRTRPALVVLESENGGLGTWDGVTNVVRHYEVSRYILDHYVPLARIAGQSFYVSRQRAIPSGERVSPGAEMPVLQSCDWGYAPLHLETTGLQAGSPARLLSPQAAVRLKAKGWAAMRPQPVPASEVVVVSEGVVRSRTRTGDRREDVAERIAPEAASSGFQIFSEWEDGGDVKPVVSFLAVGEGDRAGELQTGRETRRPAGELPVELQQLQVRSENVQGWVEDIEVSRESILQVELPPETTVGALSGIEIEVRARRSGWLTVSTDPPRALSRRWTASRDTTDLQLRVPQTPGVRIRIPADNCPSWRARSGSTLFLRSEEGLEILEVRPLKRHS